MDMPNLSNRVFADEEAQCHGEADGCGVEKVSAMGTSDFFSASGNEKFKTISKQIVPTRELDFGMGLVLKEEDLMNIALTIDFCRPDVMDSCVMVLRDVLLNGVDRNANIRADILPCGFVVSLAMQFSKFKKIAWKESFEFVQSTVKAICQRMKETGKEWMKDIDSIYFPFNIDRNRWIGVTIDLSAQLMTVFDPYALERRSSRLKPELDFICEMFPYLIRKAAVNLGMKNYTTDVISFKRDTVVEQAKSCSHTGMLLLLFIEAHVLGGNDKVYLVKERSVRERVEQLVVDMYEHWCGDIEL